MPPKKKSTKKSGHSKKETESPYVKFPEFSGRSGISASMTADGKSFIGLKTANSILSQKSTVSKDEKTTQETVQEFTIAVLERAELHKYGWFRFTPSWLQWCCNPGFLLMSLSLIAVAQGFFAHGVLPTSFRPLHLKYQIDTIQLGVIRMMHDVGMIAGFIPAVYLSMQGAKRPLWLALGCVVMTLGAFMCIVPHLRGEKLTFDQSTDDYCSQNNTSAELNSTDVSRSRIPGQNCGHQSAIDKYIFGIGVALNGFGSAAYYTMGIGYVDENVSRRTSVLYTGILNSALLVGVMLGFFINARIMDHVWVDFPDNAPKAFGSDPAKHPNWMGAWWLGVVLATLLSALSALPISGFPKRLPGAAKAHIQDAAESQSDSPDEKNAAEPAPSVFKSVKACITNVTYLGMVVEQTTYLMLVTGFAMFMPVYMRMIYNVGGYNSRVMAGIVVACALLGSIAGTVLQRLLQLTTLGNLRFSMATAWATLLFLGVFFIRCHEIKYAGGTVSYPVNDSYKTRPDSGYLKADVIAPCNLQCACDQHKYRPLCYRGSHPDRGSYGKKPFAILYFSQCYAGCLQNMTNCTCVPRDNKTWNGGGSLNQLNDCRLPKCWFKAAAAVVGLSWCAMLIFIRLNAMQHALLRCIPTKDRAVGLTMCAIVSRVVGALPAPVFMGYVLEYTCMLKTKRCDKGATCVWRNVTHLSFGTGICAFLICVFGAIGLSLAYYDFNKKSKKAKADKEKKGSSKSTKSWKGDAAMKCRLKGLAKKHAKKSAKNGEEISSKA